MHRTADQDEPAENEMRKEPYGSVLASWARAALDALRAQGIDPQPLLAAAGFSDDAFRDPNARCPVMETAHLWRLAAKRSGHPAFGIGATKHVASTSLHALGYAILASETVGGALERASCYSELIVDAGALVLEQSGPVAALGIRLCSSHSSAGIELRDGLLSALVRMLRHASAGTFSLLRVELNRSARDLSPYRSFFRCPILLGPRDVLFFDRALLAVPLSSANAELARVNDGAVREYLNRRMMPRLLRSVRAAIMTRLPTLVSPDLVASSLGVSLRSLQRSLQAHGTNYETLVREVRIDVACKYLREGQRSTSEVAFSLGYENASAFSRAFRRWTGVTPSEFVKQQSP